MVKTSSEVWLIRLMAILAEFANSQSIMVRAIFPILSPGAGPYLAKRWARYLGRMAWKGFIIMANSSSIAILAEVANF